MADKSYPYPDDERFLYLEEDNEIILERSPTRGYHNIQGIALRKFDDRETAEKAFDELVEWLTK